MSATRHRLAIVSDSHLSAAHTDHHDNFMTVCAALNASAPDLVVHGGDVSSHGILKTEHLEDARAALEAIQAPVAVVPGNRDVGDHPRFNNPKRLMTQARIDQYAALFGRSYWLRDLGEWRIIGLDSQVMDTDFPQAAAQEAWLAQVLTEAGDRPIGIVVHKPLFIDAPDASFDLPLAVLPEARHRLLAMLGPVNLQWIVSGHLHQHKVMDHGGVAHIWAPSTSFSNGHFKSDGAEFSLGFMTMDLHGAGYDLQMHRLDNCLVSGDHLPSRVA